MQDYSVSELELQLIIRNHRLHDTRRLKGITRDDLSMISGVQINRVIMAEQAKIVLSVDEQIEIGDALNVDYKWLFSDNLNETIEDGLLKVRNKTLMVENLYLRGKATLQLFAPDSTTEYFELKRMIGYSLETLTPQQKRVLQLRFGLEDGRSRTLEEVGAEFNVTRERIWQIESKALRRLRHPSRSERLKPYIFNDYEPKMQTKRTKTIITYQPKIIKPKIIYKMKKVCEICGAALKHNGYGQHLISSHPDYAKRGEHYYRDNVLSKYFGHEYGHLYTVYICVKCGKENKSPSYLIMHYQKEHIEKGLDKP